MNNNIFNAADENWFIKKTPSYKPTFPLAPAKEPVAVNLPFLKTETPKITNYSDKGGEKKSSGAKLLGENFFNIKLSPELTKAINEYLPNKNSNFIQESFDKRSNMWYHKPRNNSSGTGVGSLLTNAPTAGLQNIEKAKKASETGTPQKEVGEESFETRSAVASEKQLKKERNDFFADVDFNNLPTEEQMDFADGAFANQPGFLENNNILRSISRYVRNSAKQNDKSDLREVEENQTEARVVAPEVESKRQAARRAYEEKYRAELTEEKRKHEQEVKEALGIYHDYFSEEDREKIRNGEGIAGFLDGVNPEETDQIYNYLQDKFKNLDEEVRKEFGFYTEDIFAGVPLEIRQKIFNKLKTGAKVEYEDLVEYGLYDGEETFFEKWAADDFVSLVNKDYELYLENNSFDELSFEYNAQQAAQAQALFMEVLMGRVNGDPINLPNSKNKHRPKIVEPSPKEVVKNTPTEVPDDLSAEAPNTKPKNKQPQQFIDGKEFEKQFGKDLAEANVDVLEQPQIYNEDGTYTQPDFFFKTKDGRKGIIDAKLSSSTKLSKGQKKLFDTFDKLKLRLRGKRTQQFNGSEFLGPVDTYIVFDISKMEEGFFEKNNLEPIDLNEFLPGFTKGDKYGFYKYK